MQGVPGAVQGAVQGALQDAVKGLCGGCRVLSRCCRGGVEGAARCRGGGLCISSLLWTPLSRGQWRSSFFWCVSTSDMLQCFF